MMLEDAVASKFIALFPRRTCLILGPFCVFAFFTWTSLVLMYSYMKLRMTSVAFFASSCAATIDRAVVGHSLTIHMRRPMRTMRGLGYEERFASDFRMLAHMRLTQIPMKRSVVGLHFWEVKSDNMRCSVSLPLSPSCPNTRIPASADRQGSCHTEIRLLRRMVPVVKQMWTAVHLDHSH